VDNPTGFSVFPVVRCRVPSAGHDVFICHAFEDAEHARTICTTLEANGVRCWLPPRDPVPGVPYGRQIADAIGASRVLLLVFSSHANDSRAVTNELELAMNAGKAIVPVRVEDVAPSRDLAFYVKAVHWFDAATLSPEDVTNSLPRHVERLCADEATIAKHNLPRQLSSFVGRENELAEIAELLKVPGFVTLVGAGGIGKTRCALAVATAVVDEFADGVWFVDLAPVADPALANAIAQAFDLPLSPNLPPLDTVVGYLKRKHLLLVLDNCEHVVAQARAVVATILHACPEVHILATSREGLHVAGEQQYRLPSLAVPPPDAPAQEILNFAGARLFADRALAVDRRFVIGDDNARYVGEICRRLDGIPLAIELAAARVNVLSPQQLAQKLDEWFRVLTGGDRTALARHQTMRALIDWSYDLLTEDEQRVFRTLSVFAGGCTLQTATTVCSEDEIVTLERLSSLVEKSLLQAEPSDGGTRYQLLESMRQYAHERLVERGEGK
jgi:predicted ATPase